jgi:signal transduction histidine kinase
VLISGLVALGAVFVGQGLISAFLISGTLARTRSLRQRSIDSVGVVSRMVRDLEQERIIVDDHTYEERPAAMATVEKHLDAVVADYERADAEYARLIDFPEEVVLWRKTQVLAAHFRRVCDATLALSRNNLNVRARERMRDVREDYDELSRTLYGLLEVNREGVIQSTKRIESMMRSTEHATWVTRIIGFSLLVLLGSWMTRRVSLYERRITGYARALEERNGDLDAFAGRVAHDLMSALSAVSLIPTLLRRDKADPARVLAIADRAERSSHRAKSVIDALLAFSRAAHEAEAEEAGDVRAAVQSVLEELAPTVERLGVTVEVGELPDVFVRCAPGLLEVVLANLCGNAVKYLDGQEERSVRVSARREGDGCRIEVADTGPGIRKEAQERIFEPFYRAEGTRAPGIGIGLATVRRIVAARGGRIAVESQLGHGARFAVWLPIVPSPVPGWPARAEPPRPSLAR